MSKKLKVIVIGGGASGLVAAIVAARNGADVRVIERMSRVGKKLLATGNGRCNLTNRYVGVEHYHGSSPTFISGVLDRFNLSATAAFFGGLGIATIMEEDGKLYPASEQAASVLDVLRYEMERLGVVEVCDTRIQRVDQLGKRFRCVSTDEDEFSCDRVIVATGGKSAPNMGSNGGGYKIATAMGHRVVDPFPALVQVNLDAQFLKRLKGLKLKGTAEVIVDGEARRCERGDLLFADYGISGPPILQISRLVSKATLGKREVFIRLDLFPDLTVKALADLLKLRISANPEKETGFSFVGLIHKRLIPVILKEVGIGELNVRCGSVPENMIERLADVMKNWLLRCTGTQSWMSSQVTAGGVDTGGLDVETLESKKVPGVYFAGEVLDVDGDSGGYNLQWAWSSGYRAGLAAASAE